MRIRIISRTWMLVIWALALLKPFARSIQLILLVQMTIFQLFLTVLTMMTTALAVVVLFLSRRRMPQNVYL